MPEILHGRLFRVSMVFLVAATLSVLATSPAWLIMVGNGLVLSVSVGVIVAYAPVVFGALRAPEPTKGDFLALGIFVAWVSVLMMRVLSILVRDFGQAYLVNSHFPSWVVLTALFAGILHLWAPQAVEGRIPRERWVKWGICFAVGVGFIFFVWALRVPGEFALRPFVEIK